MIKYKVCRDCEKRESCLIDGIPSEEKLQALADRLGGIWLPENCPLRRDRSPEKVVFT
jgi:hypothetical protein